MEKSCDDQQIAKENDIVQIGQQLVSVPEENHQAAWAPRETEKVWIDNAQMIGNISNYKFLELNSFLFVPHFRKESVANDSGGCLCHLLWHCRWLLL